ncbi:hypothetical protein RUM43_004992 [Polyplax serrata]|uniref:TEP1-F n=1 Tax=Polyplax serrata TaxID=468196 RepID=A0AAN8SBK3_POLSC
MWKMGSPLFLDKFFILWYLLGVTSAADSGFLFTAPRTLLAGHEENVCITFKNDSNVAQVEVKIMELKEDVEIASVVEKLTEADQGAKCFKIPLPKTKLRSGRIQLIIRSKTDGDFSVNYIEKVSIQPNSDLTFIVTDKPVYNDGQTVRFRIFVLKYDLTPIDEPIDKIWIENPNGIHLVQWLNASTQNGIVNKTFQLAKEPMPGKWHIKMKKAEQDTVKQSFLVDNYILPKFSVVLKTPNEMNLTANVTICARYLFGEPVQGDVQLQYFVKCSFSYYCQEDVSSVTRNLKLGKDGCIKHDIILKSPSSFAQSVMVNASVVEEGTLIRGKALAKIEIRNSRRKNLPEFSLGTKMRKFKPGLPFRGEIVMKTSVESDEKFAVCFDSNGLKSCRNLFVRKGKSNFLLLPEGVADEKNFKATVEIQNFKGPSQKENQVTKLNLLPWYSPSGSYVQLEMLAEGPLQCNQHSQFNVLYSMPESSIRFHYLIKSRGIILMAGTLDEFSSRAKPFEYEESDFPINPRDISSVKRFQININITSIMSPKAYLLVYHIRNDGEIVADTLSLTVGKCLPNKVKAKWTKSMTPPGSDNRLLIESSLNSLCAVSVTDKAVQLVSTPNGLGIDRVLNEFEVNHETYHESPNNHCRADEEIGPQFPTDEMEYLSEPRQMDSRFVDSLQAFKDFGTLVITDLDLETRPCREDLEHGKHTIDTMRSSNVNVTGNEIENISMFEAEEFPVPEDPNFREFPMAQDLRIFFPESWIWDLVHVNETGSVDMNLQVPDTITEWTTDVICVNDKYGIGIDTQSTFMTYRPFFLHFVAPHSLNRREIFHLQVSLFNYETTEIPVRLTYVSTGSFISKAEESVSYCIRPKSKIVHRFTLEAVRVGEAPISVKAEMDTSFPGNCGNVVSVQRDIVTKKTLIKHEGFPVEDIKSGFICSDSPNFDHEVTWTLKVPPDVIESSITVDALISGDILGPSLKNLDHLISLPTGCGEQNMILLVPNILLLDYILLTKSDDLELVERALKNLDLGYQRQLNYKHPEGYYSAFGEQDGRGSIWLTSFVVRYLSQAKKYIYVDGKDLNASVSWIMKQQLENGCFPMVGKIYHRNFNEKLLEEDSSKVLSAYILMSLIEAGVPQDNPVIKNTIFCLKPTEESLGTYGDLLSAYALILAGEYRDSQALMLELLKDSKRSYGMLWWESGDSIESAIEMTGYGILTLVKLGGPHFLAAASDALRWIIQYQNQNGGFVSSQDTVLALEAISKFSATLPRTGQLDQLTVRAETMGEEYSFNITDTNRMLQQKVSLPTFATDIHFHSTGKGCALVQTHLKYNVRRGNPSKDLKIQLRIHSVSDVDSFAIAKFQICVRYKRAKDKINMAVLEVPMVSGYYPDRTSLYEIRTTKKGVRRWEEYEEKVNFYFEDLKNKKICVNFLVVQEVCVENSGPALIKLYDYYNTQHESSVKYNLTPQCHNGSWASTQDNVKQESKRDLRYEQSLTTPIYEVERFESFTNFDPDLATPQGVGGVPPVYALPPKPDGQGPHCAHCLQDVPDIFPRLYCSAQVAVKIFILSKHIFEFYLDLSPRINMTAMRRPVSFTMKKECQCSILNSVGSFALLMVTPPRTFNTQRVQEIHLDDSVQLYPWGNPEKTPKFLTDAIHYCKKWPYEIDY